MHVLISPKCPTRNRGVHMQVFLTGLGLVNNQAGILRLSDTGKKFFSNPSSQQLADVIQDKVRLFGETLAILAEKSLTVEAVDEQLCKTYGLDWAHLNNTRRRMDWLEVLGLIVGVGNREWSVTSTGEAALARWTLVSPDVLESLGSDAESVEILEPPAEIAELLKDLAVSPDAQNKRKTYNIWVPSPNRIDNLRKIIQVASERISKGELFSFIENEFNLKSSSADSMLPFLKASGLLHEVGRSVYSATAAANAWLETGNDLDFIRILHSNMRFVGEMLEASKNDITRNDLYTLAKSYGLNVEKTRWIAGFLLEAGLLEEPKYLHLITTPTGTRLAETLPLADAPMAEVENTSTDLNDALKDVCKVSAIDQILEDLERSSCDPVADGKQSGVAFEEAIAHTFQYMGFVAKRIGGSGDTDVVLQWQDDGGSTVTAIVDGKSKSGGRVAHTDISDVAIDTHKEKNSASYVGIVGPGFSGETIRHHARKKEYALITVEQLCGIVRASESIGLSLQEIALIFQVPSGLSQLDELIAIKQRELAITSTVISRLRQEQETYSGLLSPRDLFMMLRDAEISPSQEELLNVVSVLSKQEIGVLRAVGETGDPENTKYELHDAKKAANQLHALALTINEAMSS